MTSAGEGGAFHDALSENLERIDMHAEDEALLAVASVLEDKGVVLLGETHGVAENARNRQDLWIGFPADYAAAS